MHHLFVSSIFIQNYLVLVFFFFFFTANLNSGTQLFVCSIQSRKTGFIILYKQKAEKDWWVTLVKLATHATLAYYRHHQYMLLGTKSRTHSHVTAALEASNIDFFTNRMKNWNVKTCCVYFLCHSCQWGLWCFFGWVLLQQRVPLYLGIQHSKWNKLANAVLITLINLTQVLCVHVQTLLTNKRWYMYSWRSKWHQ